MSRRTRIYEVAGFVFAAGERIAGLPEAAAKPVSRFRIVEARAPRGTRWYHDARLADGRAWPALGRRAGGFAVRFDGACTFLISAGGAKVEACPHAGADAATVRRLFLDQVIPLLLNLSGRECLHASAVAIGGRACAFLGGSGAGKSTLAASVSLAGCDLLADDCVALDCSAAGVAIRPGNRGAKLWPDSAAGLALSAGALPPLDGHPEKKWLAAARSTSQPLPLHRIYLITPAPAGAAPEIAAASPQEAVPALVESAFRLDLTDAGMLARQFTCLVHVARSVPVRRLIYPRDFASLDATRDAILADVREEGA